MDGWGARLDDLLGSRCRCTNPIKTPWHTHTVMMMPEQLLPKSYVPIVGQQQQELMCVLFTLHHCLTLSLHPLYTCVCVCATEKENNKAPVHHFSINFESVLSRVPTVKVYELFQPKDSLPSFIFWETTVPSLYSPMTFLGPHLVGNPTP